MNITVVSLQFVVLTSVTQDHVIGETELCHSSGGFGNLVGRGPWVEDFTLQQGSDISQTGAVKKITVQNPKFFYWKNNRCYMRITNITSIFF